MSIAYIRNFKYYSMNKNLTVALACALAVGASFTSCKMKKGGHIAVDDDAAKKVYVAPVTTMNSMILSPVASPVR